MLKSCAKCNKTVYPTEKLSCLDKTWHKLCFKCETCAMQLNMKNYKGYQKKPYCNTHYPTTKFTSVADTPENLRLKKNTTNQSSAVYHKEFEKDKGKFTAVADDPETLRNKKTQMQASDLKYQERFNQEKGQFTSVADDPETLRNKKIQQQASDSAYKAAQSRDQAPPQSRYNPPPTQAAPSPPAQVAPPPPSQAAPAPPSPEPEPEPEPEAAPEPAAGGAPGATFVAIYDYTAGDDDEVSFVEGDIILDGEAIDDGWMTGTVQRTGENGMLPSNYVEPQ